MPETNAVPAALQNFAADNLPPPFFYVCCHIVLSESVLLFRPPVYVTWTVLQTDLPVHDQFPVYMFQTGIRLLYPYMPDIPCDQCVPISVLNLLMSSYFCNCYYSFLFSSLSFRSLLLRFFLHSTDPQSLLCDESPEDISEADLLS